MANETSENRETCTGAASHPRGHELPERLARLINPTVRTERTAIIETRIRDEVRERVRRRRCAEIITNHLLETVND